MINVALKWTYLYIEYGMNGRCFWSLTYRGLFPFHPLIPVNIYVFKRIGSIMIGNMVMNLDLIVKYLSVKCQASASPVPNLFTCITLSSISIQGWIEHEYQRNPRLQVSPKIKILYITCTILALLLYIGPDGNCDHRVTVETDHRYTGIGTMSVEGTSEANYLWRPATATPFPRPRTSNVGEIGWQVPQRTDWSLPITGRQIIVRIHITCFSKKFLLLFLYTL